MSIEAIPGERDCLILLEKYKTPNHIILHSKKVWDVGRLVGEGLLRQNHALDMALLRASCLFHDIGKYPCLVDGEGYHDLRGEQILVEEGLPSVARIVVQHVVLRGSRDAPVGEEHILFYADKRVVHDEIVNLDDRFVYLYQTYGRNPEAVKKLHVMKEETIRLEEKIFMLLDFLPLDVDGLVGQWQDSSLFSE
jgi:hypothetical protein